MRNKVVVVGSYNIDQTIRVRKIPSPGETIIGSGFSSGSGGKGANQAVAAARAGAAVTFVAKVGTDPLTLQALADLKHEGIDTSFIIRDEKSATGRAWIVVDDSGENSIVVAPGANAQLSPADVALAADAIAAANVLLLQLETPIETVMTAAKIAAAAGTTVILNPAPAQPLSPEFLKLVDIITPNIVEAKMLTGISCRDDQSLTTAALSLQHKGVKDVLITLGKKGVFVHGRDGMFCVPAYQVNAVDTTGAGDVFNGCLAAFLNADRSMREVLDIAAAAAAISVTKNGAQAAAPHFSEIESFCENYSIAR